MRKLVTGNLHTLFYTPTRLGFFPKFTDSWAYTFLLLGVYWFMFATAFIIFDISFIRSMYDMLKSLNIKWYCAYMMISILLPVGIAVFVAIAEFIYYNSKYKLYVLETQKQNDISEKNNEKVTIIRENKKNEIINQIEEARKYYNTTMETLDRLYMVGIIYEKYRNMVAVGMFCEYFDSGRCSTLEGHEGAYNIFENEIRQNIIISKLDVIITELEKIEQNQYMIYQAIQDSNKKIREVSSEILSSQQTIQQNQRAIEYYNSITAKNTEFLKWERILNAT